MRLKLLMICKKRKWQNKQHNHYEGTNLYEYTNEIHLDIRKKFGIS